MLPGGRTDPEACHEEELDSLGWSGVRTTHRKDWLLASRPCASSRIWAAERVAWLPNAMYKTEDGGCMLSQSMLMSCSSSVALLRAWCSDSSSSCCTFVSRSRGPISKMVWVCKNQAMACCYRSQNIQQCWVLQKFLCFSRTENAQEVIAKPRT